MESTTGAGALELAPTGPGDLVDQLNQAAGRRAVAPWVGAALVVLALALGIWGLVILVIGVPLVWWLNQWDRARRTVIAFYEVDGPPATWFESLVQRSSDLSAAQNLWRIQAAGAITTTHQHKTNAGASRVVARQVARAGLGGPPRLRTNVDVPTISVGGESLAFLPDRVLLQHGRTFSDIGYDHLQVRVASSRFIEDGKVPADADQVGTTWKYVNVKGGPDRRYKDNRQLPVMLYADLQLTSDTGLRWDLKVSSIGRAEGLQRALDPGPRYFSSSVVGSAVPVTPLAAVAPPPPAPAVPPLPPVAGPARRLHRLAGTGRVAVVGESHYQEALALAAGGRSSSSLDTAIEVRATLVPEPENSYDRHAVRVCVGASTVGYLSRDIAPLYQPVLLDSQMRGLVGECTGWVMGGGQRMYGIHLHLSPPDTFWPVNQPSGRPLWPAEREVTVTGEESHQEAIASLLPPSTSATTAAAFASLGTCTIARGKHAGARTVEVTLDGHRVGQLTKAQADRYLATVDASLAAGLAPGCHALVHRTADRGLQVTVFLPRT